MRPTPPPLIFQDRLDAARQLVAQLQPYRDQQPRVLAIPRGAVPMAKALAAALRGDFDVVLVRKLGAPFSLEYAIGSVDESGWTYIIPNAAALGADADYIVAEKQRQMETIRQRRAQYTPLRTAQDSAGRTVLVVDDGMATGATMVAALRGLRLHQPRTLVCAVPVSSPQALEKIRPLADVVVCLQGPDNFRAVGQFYRDFPQVEDSEVMALLQR